MLKVVSIFTVNTDASGKTFETDFASALNKSPVKKNIRIIALSILYKGI